MFDYSKGRLLPNTDTQILAEIESGFYYRLFKGALRSEGNSPAMFMRRMRNLLWQYVEICDDTITIVAASSGSYVLTVTMDRDYFEMTITDKAENISKHLLSWQFAGDWDGVTWEEFWICLKGWMSDGIAQLRGLQAVWEAQEGQEERPGTETPGTE